MDLRFFRLRTVFYLAYALILTACLLYLRFPAEKIKLYCEKRVEYFLSDSDCSIARISYRFPFSVTFSNFQITRKVDERTSGFHLDHFTVTPDFSTFFRKFDIDGEIYDGSFFLKFEIDDAEKSFMLNGVSIQGLNTSKWVNDFNVLDRNVSGIAGISGNYQAMFSDPLAGTGKGELVLVDGVIELLQPVLSLSNLEFERITVETTQEKEVLRFSAGEVSGNQVNAEFAGEMRTTLPLLNSIIQLTGHLTPKEEFLAAHPEEKLVVDQLVRRYKMPALPFKLGGSLRSPTFRFSM